ncbi:MAG: MarR family transcriptional regulator [Chelatococcus sp.]|nr:MAG: MarR family transcriptional regulator [Chelatococcus sp.]
MSKTATDGATGQQLDDLVCFAVYSASHAFNQLYKPLLDALGLTYPQYLVMLLLWAKDDRTVGELGEELLLESNTLTPLLKRLESAGLIGRSRDPADERKVRVRLSERGKALRDEAQEVPACIGEATGLSFPELRRLTGEINALRRALLRRP